MSQGSLGAALTSLALLASWVGAALFVAAVVAPAAFAVLPTRTLAGALVGRALPVLFVSGIAFGCVVVVLNGAMRAGIGVTASGGVFAAASATALLIGLQIARMRASFGGTIDALDVADPRRIAFGRLHGVSVLCVGIGMVAATIASIVIVRHLTTRSSFISAPR